MIRPNLHKKIASKNRKHFEYECSKLDKREKLKFDDFSFFDDSFTLTAINI